jgi:DNA (cytosine-5)-methyltransferase 1
MDTAPANALRYFRRPCYLVGSLLYVSEKAPEMKVLNLYACLGGNRLKWTDCEVTAVELDPELARLYQERFPGDTVIVGDAHKYLLDHYKEFDFIWSSPPCPSHSKAAFGSRKSDKSNHKPVYPDMTLYQEIIFLQHYFSGKYCVENVVPYYEPLIPAKKRGRHLYWTNFNLPEKLSERIGFKNMIDVGNIYQLSEFHEYNFRQYKGKQRIDKIARNLVDYEAGLTIFEVARGSWKQKNNNQLTIF